MSRAAAFKRAYRLQWHVSNQKEAFVKVFLESFGFRVKPVGLGALEEDYLNRSGSLPDFAVYHPISNELLFYVEVTGSNVGIVSDEIWVTYDKFRKYNCLRGQYPIYFFYLGLESGKMKKALFIEYEDLYPYSEKKENIKKINIRGNTETFIVTPFSLWKPLKKFIIEVKDLL